MIDENYISGNLRVIKYISRKKKKKDTGREQAAFLQHLS